MIHRVVASLLTGVAIFANANSADAQWAVDPIQQIPLFDDFDRFGNQFQVVQSWNNGSGDRTTYSIYDTGASVVTLSSSDQLLFDLLGTGTVPIKTPNGASATAIGGSGTLVGDVSMPGSLRVAGMSAINQDYSDILNFGGIDPTAGIEVPGIQMFVGTQAGSSVLPTIAGTPIHIPSANPGYEAGSAAHIDMRSYQLDLEALLGDSSFAGIFLPVPDVAFVPRDMSLTGKADTFAPITIPVTLHGMDNTANPGDLPSISFNPIVPGVRTTNGANVDENRNFLFDTGAQLSIISTETALQLGLDLNFPEDTIDIQGASGTASIPGFTIDTLRLPRDVPGEFLEFSNVPVYVLDIGEGIDGILGMNLFNGADELLYDPFRSPSEGGPQFSVTFLHDRSSDIDAALAEAVPELDVVYADAEIQALISGLSDLIDLYEELDLLPPDFDKQDTLAGLNSLLALQSTGYGSRFAVQGPLFIGFEPVPEPASGLLAILSLAGFVTAARRRPKPQ